MKHFVPLPYLFLILFGFAVINLSAQKRGESVITAGVGIGYLNLAVTLEGAANDNIKTTAIPTLNFMYDLGLQDNFSMGLAVGYNTISIIEEKTVTNFPSAPVTYKSDGNYTRLNIALRPMFHWGKKEDMDWHAGVRLGYSMWDYTFSSDDPYATPKYDDQDLYSLQVLVGARAYFSEKVGMTVDLGVGTPYFVGIGMSFKL